MIFPNARGLAKGWACAMAMRRRLGKAEIVYVVGPFRPNPILIFTAIEQILKPACRCKSVQRRRSRKT